LARGRAEGKAEGKAAAILTFLAGRGLDVSEVVRAHILSCRDADLLDTWLERAATCASADELIAPQ
ncbi:MAG: hypothetical protein OEY14_11885, partial [Myxococcales bacterium]|nr:hypothetical protein [Myxococcales bacterium]